MCALHFFPQIRTNVTLSALSSSFIDTLQIPYARSEIHVHELLENICDKSRAYRLVTHPTTGKRVYVDREITDLKGDESQELTGNLQSAVSFFHFFCKCLMTSCPRVIDDLYSNRLFCCMTLV